MRINIGKIAYLTDTPMEIIKELTSCLKGELVQEENFFKLYSPLGRFFIFDINNLPTIFEEEKFAAIRIIAKEIPSGIWDKAQETIGCTQFLISCDLAKIEKSE